MIKKWTAEQDKYLRHLWMERGLSLMQIGRRMGKTRNAIAGRIHRLGMSGLGDRLPGQSFRADYGDKVVPRRP
jgi:hypothetical protein